MESADPTSRTAARGDTKTLHMLAATDRACFGEGNCVAQHRRVHEWIYFVVDRSDELAREFDPEGWRGGPRLGHVQRHERFRVMPLERLGYVREIARKLAIVAIREGVVNVTSPKRSEQQSLGVEVGLRDHDLALVSASDRWVVGTS